MLRKKCQNWIYQIWLVCLHFITWDLLSGLLCDLVGRSFIEICWYILDDDNHAFGTYTQKCFFVLPFLQMSISQSNNLATEPFHIQKHFKEPPIWFSHMKPQNKTRRKDADTVKQEYECYLIAGTIYTKRLKLMCHIFLIFYVKSGLSSLTWYWIAEVSNLVPHLVCCCILLLFLYCNEIFLGNITFILQNLWFHRIPTGKYCSTVNSDMHICRMLFSST
jgi:hypothetical protein